jgi:regulator of protease activity HflC (stomatin/prohibitin superfamily)
MAQLTHTRTSLGAIAGRRFWIVAALVLTALVMVWQSTTTVRPGHNKVATLFGEVRPTPYAEGFHLVNPLLDFTSFDLRQQTRTWQKVEVPAQDKLKTTMDVSLTFRIEGSATPTILQETGTVDDVIEKHVTPKVRSLLREAGKSVALSQDFFRESVQQELQAYMEAGLVRYLAPKGVIVEAVLFRDITLPEVVRNAVIQTKERQEQLEREKAQLQIVEQQAQQQVKQAQAREQAAIADANAKRTQADAEAYRIRSEALARAEANAAIARSITPQLLRYNEVERWDGGVPHTLLGGEAGGLILDLGSERR